MSTTNDKSHAHTHGLRQEKASLWLPAISFFLLLAGIWLQYKRISWFEELEAAWFLVAFLPVGIPVMKEAWEAILEKDFFSEFTLMLIASIGAFCIGEYPEAVAVMLFYTIGEQLQNKAVDKATRNISRLLDVRPERAEVWRDGAYATISPKEVKVGEHIEVKPGGRVPLDGYLLDDGAEFDTSALTGESLPRSLSKGEEVLAGMIVCGQSVHLKVCRPYEHSALARILDLVQDAAERKAPTELFIRRFARIYTPIVIALAALIVAIPALVGAWVPSFTYVFSEWLYRGLVFLVISCPCALVISVPLGYFAGIGVASRRGILFKGGNYLDAITQVNTVAFDKTGTLTTGRFEVIGMDCEPKDIPGLLSLLLSVERKSTHPIAQAIVRYAEKRGAQAIEIPYMRELAGHGAEAEVEGRQVLIGNTRLLKERGIKMPKDLSNEVSTHVFCAVDGQYKGHLSLADTLRDDAKETIQRLKELGVQNVCLLSGDKQAIVDKFAQYLGIDEAYGNLLPEDKATCVEQLTRQENRSVAFVGDGMNDAPVLALSDVGIAMGGLGSDAAIESADIIIQTDQPSKVAEAITIGRSTRVIVRQNIIGSIGVKMIILLAGIFGFASLWGAVFADVGVSLLAVLNSIRLFGLTRNTTA